MERADPAQHLRHVDGQRNMARFYMLSIEPTLVGGAVLLRHWGRIGTRGRQKIEIFDTPDEAAAALVSLTLAKRRRGYVDHR